MNFNLIELEMEKWLKMNRSMQGMAFISMFNFKFMCCEGQQINPFCFYPKKPAKVRVAYIANAYNIIWTQNTVPYNERTSTYNHTYS